MRVLSVILALLLSACGNECDVSRLRIGMTAAELLNVCGDSSRHSVGYYGGKVKIQWVYRANDVYVYTEDGLVTSWQWDY